jgi:hypothetical protein
LAYLGPFLYPRPMAGALAKLQWAAEAVFGLLKLAAVID